jgi:hypothetical protein
MKWERIRPYKWMYHRWFAWYPVKILGSSTVYWLEFVWRKKESGWWYFEKDKPTWEATSGWNFPKIKKNNP